MGSFPPAVVVLYPVTVLFSAALLFLVEPMVGKLLLPSLGGSPEVWITTLLFFQAALLAGYAYGHVVAGRLTPRRQTLLHLALLVVALAVLPISVHPGSPRSGSAHPTLWLLGQLAVTVGLPFFAVAANGPLLQHWLAGTRHRSARDPFFLYAASNLGSVLGLLAYPALIEPLLALHTQTRAWAWGYGALVLLVGGCAVTVWRLSGAGSPAPVRPTTPPDHSADGEPETAAGPERSISPTWGRRARWVALAFVASSFMLGTTTFITRDLAPVPLLWVIPLAIYLVSFVIAFARGSNPTRLVAATRRALPVVLIALVYTMAIGSQRPLWLLLALHLIALLATALLCHARLAEDRPSAEHLTGFYLWVSVGGVLGGVFNALLAPVVFPSLIEYPVAIVAACLLRPRSPRSRPTIIAMLTGKDRLGRVIDVAVAATFGLALAAGLEATTTANPTTAFAHRSTILGFAAGLAVNFARRPLRFALAIAAVFLAATVGAGTP
ncbi:MAG: hypothetical protein LC720_07215, partial [Actinobacteria bacterium]|nr:hypothetical protein [Actinomycetota bacterium]